MTPPVPTAAVPSAHAARVLRVGVWRPGRGDANDVVAAEEPLEIRVNGAPLVVTMRTPGDDEELAIGYLLTEGLIRDAADVASVLPVGDVPPDARGNVVDVRLRGRSASGGAARVPEARRRGFVTSACGVCGQATIDSVRRRAPALPAGRGLTTACLVSLAGTLRSAQPVFSETGGLHAAGLFDLHGRLIAAREDVGRHNAVDKVIGHAVLGCHLPLTDTVLVASGRAGFEIVLKAWMAGIPILASVSAPSSLAVQLADEADMTLIGFLRGRDFTVYGGGRRLVG